MVSTNVLSKHQNPCFVPSRIGFGTASILTLGRNRGSVTNILFENFYLDGPSVGLAISQSSGNNGLQPPHPPDSSI